MRGQPRRRAPRHPRVPADMIERGWGRILTIVSDAGRKGERSQVVYGAAKAAAMGFSRGLAAEVGREGVTVNCISLGTMPHGGRRGATMRPAIEEQARSPPVSRRAPRPGRRSRAPRRPALQRRGRVDHRPGVPGRRRLRPGPVAPPRPSARTLLERGAVSSVLQNGAGELGYPLWPVGPVLPLAAWPLARRTRRRHGILEARTAKPASRRAPRRAGDAAASRADAGRRAPREAARRQLGGHGPDAAAVGLLVVAALLTARASSATSPVRVGSRPRRRGRHAARAGPLRGAGRAASCSRSSCFSVAPGGPARGRGRRRPRRARRRAEPAPLRVAVGLALLVRRRGRDPAPRVRQPRDRRRRSTTLRDAGGLARRAVGAPAATAAAGTVGAGDRARRARGARCAARAGRADARGRRRASGAGARRLGPAAARVQRARTPVAATVDARDDGRRARRGRGGPVRGDPTPTRPEPRRSTAGDGRTLYDVDDSSGRRHGRARPVDDDRRRSTGRRADVRGPTCRRSTPRTTGRPRSTSGRRPAAAAAAGSSRRRTS